MSQKKKRIAMEAAEAAAYRERKENYLSTEEKEFRTRLNIMRAKDAYIFLAVIGAGTEKKKRKEHEKPKLQTAKQAAAIAKEIKKELKAMAPMPTPPYTVIIPAPSLSKFTPSALCDYFISRVPRIDAITNFDDCLPGTGYCKVIYDELFPLASIGKGISREDRIAMNIYVKQLCENFGATISSIANLCLGNAKLFALINVKTKSKGVRNTKRLAAPVVTISTIRGGKSLGVKCKPIKYAKSYTVAIGTGDDVSFYKQYVGSSNQLIEGLTGGDLVNVVMWANTGKQAGYPSVAQPVRVPY